MLTSPRVFNATHTTSEHPHKDPGPGSGCLDFYVSLYMWQLHRSRAGLCWKLIRIKFHNGLVRATVGQLKWTVDKKISQCEDTSPSAFINFSFGRGPFPISLPLCSGSRCPLAYLHTFILKCLHTCIHIIEKTSNSYRNNAIEKLACHCIDQQQIEKQCW